jgi:hypothetical protein
MNTPVTIIQYGSLSALRGKQYLNGSLMKTYHLQGKERRKTQRRQNLEPYRSALKIYTIGGFT